jgi:hypothetical protein
MTLEFRERRRKRAYRMCLGKKAHAWKDQAEQHRQRLADLPDVVDPERLEVYCCLYCWHWHIGHTPKTKITLRDHSGSS